MQEISALKKLLDKPKRIFVTTHHKPDGDAMGSMLAISRILIQKGHTVSMVSPSDFGHYLQWMPDVENVLNFEKKSRQALDFLQKAEVIICLDFNHPDRVHALSNHLLNARGTKVVIDHHTEPHPFSDILISDTNSCATAELLFVVIDQIWGRDAIDQEMATCLYTGIVTDSGSFRFDNVTRETHNIAGFLMEKGIDNAAIHRNLYDNNPLQKLKFFGYCLSNKMVVMEDYKTAYIHVTHEELKKYNIGTGETEGLVNYPLSIEGIVFAALIIDRGEIVKLSFRSIGEFPANKFARSYFEGGGHFNAAGGMSPLSLTETVKKFEEKVHEMFQELQES
jgi:bifunctional oligoribonuclease and PAP phosphatase NrnA